MKEYALFYLPVCFVQFDQIYCEYSRPEWTLAD